MSKTKLEKLEEKKETLAKKIFLLVQHGEKIFNLYHQTDRLTDVMDLLDLDSKSDFVVIVFDKGLKAHTVTIGFGMSSVWVGFRDTFDMRKYLVSSGAIANDHDFHSLFMRTVPKLRRHNVDSKFPRYKKLLSLLEEHAEMKDEINKLGRKIVALERAVVGERKLKRQGKEVPQEPEKKAAKAKKPRVQEKEAPQEPEAPASAE